MFFSFFDSLRAIDELYWEKENKRRIGQQQEKPMSHVDYSVGKALARIADVAEAFERRSRDAEAKRLAYQRQQERFVDHTGGPASLPLCENRIDDLQYKLLKRFGSQTVSVRGVAEEIERDIIAPAIKAASTPAGAKPHITKSTIIAAMNALVVHEFCDPRHGSPIIKIEGKEAVADAILYALYGDQARGS